MPRQGRGKGDRKREDFEWRQRDQEYRTMARELHQQWCERLPEENELTEESSSAEPTDG